MWPSMTECMDCNAEGTLSDDVWVPCPFCDGTGLVCSECGFSDKDCTCEDAQ